MSIRRSSRSARRRRLPALVALVTFVAAVTDAAPVLAGMDTIVHFTNLSPYTATVQFRAGDNECWYDDGAQDGRVEEYQGYYRRGAVSDAGYRDFLDAYKNATGIGDLADVKHHDMKDARVDLAPAVAGGTADTALFVGETSAALFGGCKLKTSRRGFDVTLTDEDGAQLSAQHYVLADPPDSEWTLTRTSSSTGGSNAASITLGAGGHGDPIEIAVTATIATLTLVTLGTATAELIAARAAVAAATQELAAAEAFLAYAFDYTPRVVNPLWRQMFSYAMRGGLRVAANGAREVYLRGHATSIVARVFYTALVNGSIVIYEHFRDKDPVKVPDGTVIDARTAGIDFGSPSLLVNSALPDERSICIYQTDTLGITECRLVGIDLTIMPDGSMVFMPLPSVGGGD
jgi:hypothetical protein